MSEMLTSLNPASGEPAGQVPITPTAEIPAVVARARAALPAWRDLGVEGRLEALLPAGAKLVERADELGALLTREMGKPLPEGIGEVRGCGADMEETLRDIAAALQPDVHENERVRSTVYHEPLGVCAAITPWNFPLAMPHWMVVPALMAGNTVVLKPSEETPLIAQAYADVLNESLPKDVLCVIHGADAQGKALVQADVDLIAFTGSREAGKHILAEASGDLKRVILELGGKDPMIVLDDADVEKVADFAVKNSFRNAGQVCVSVERIYVDAKIADAFEAEVARRTGELKVGPGTEEGVFLGPMIHGRQKEHVVRQVADAVAQGARVVAGGEGHHGNFFVPTVLADLNHAMGIMREETFGPVACLVRFQDVDEAVRLANDTPFGLGATVHGTDVARATAVARRLDAGMIGVNKSCGGAEGTPWVGAKQSGYGYHHSKQGHRQFTIPRVVSVPKPRS